MLRSTLLKPAQTRRWMRPVASTESPSESYGYGWEISRSTTLPISVDVATGNPSSTTRVSDVYYKLGSIPPYQGSLVLSPDHAIGWTVQFAGASPSQDEVRIRAILRNIWAPAAEQAGRDHAAALYAGNYTLPTPHGPSFLELDVAEGRPGVSVQRWFMDGVDVFATFKTLLIDQLPPGAGRFRATGYPTGLEGGGRVSYRLRTDIEAGGTTVGLCSYGAGSADDYKYGLQAADRLEFIVGDDGKATGIYSPIFGATLSRQ
jgi:hypothetical protein